MAARTLPGRGFQGIVFHRAAPGHNKFGAYTEMPDEYQEVMDRLAQKHKAAAKFVPRAGDSCDREGARFGVVGIGGCDPACARRWMSWRRAACPPIICASAGSRSMRASKRFSANTSSASWWSRIATRNCKSLLTLETNVPKEKLRSVLVYGGFPLSARHVVDRILPQIEN